MLPGGAQLGSTAVCNSMPWGLQTFGGHRHLQLLAGLCCFLKGFESLCRVGCLNPCPSAWQAVELKLLPPKNAWHLLATFWSLQGIQSLHATLQSYVHTAAQQLLEELVTLRVPRPPSFLCQGRLSRPLPPRVQLHWSAMCRALRREPWSGAQ